MLAIIIEGVIGDFSSAQAYFPTNQQDGILPSVGHPFVVLNDGTLSLPLIDPINVRGLTVAQSRNAITKAYVDQEFLKDANNASVVLLRKRTVNVTVLHDRQERGYGVTVKLPADRAQAIVAMAQTGPFDVYGDVRVIGKGNRNRLKEGDIVQVSSKRQGYFYSGGLTVGGRHKLPQNRPLNPLQAIALAGGYKQSPRRLPGGLQVPRIAPTRVTIVRANRAAFTISYAQLLANPNAYLIQPGDTIIPR